MTKRVGRHKIFSAILFVLTDETLAMNRFPLETTERFGLIFGEICGDNKICRNRRESSIPDAIQRIYFQIILNRINGMKPTGGTFFFFRGGGCGNASSSRKNVK